MRAQLRELPPPEIAMGQAGMGNGQAGLGYPVVTVQNDIEIERAWRPAGHRVPDPPGGPLDGLAGVEQRAGGERGAQEHHVLSVIYADRIWTSWAAYAGWRDYVHPSGDTRNPVLRHLDHVHVAVESGRPYRPR